MVALTVTQAGCQREQQIAGKVVGSSMSPSLLGDHYFAICPDCGIELTCDIEQADKRQTLVCANCGGVIQRKACEKRKADEVIIGLSKSAIERWDIVAFRMTPESNVNGNQ